MTVPLRVDHVSVAWSDLDALRAAYADVGLPTEYGGVHSNGETHMATLGFADGSYLELVSTVEAGAESPLWDAHVRGDGGTCAWAVRVDDAGAVAETLRGRGVAVEGPVAMERRRPDGTVAAWELVFLGDGEPGATLPFCIADETPRERRITPTGAAADAGLNGVERVVLGVPDLDDAVDRFRRAFDLPGPERDRAADLGASVAAFPDAPVTLAAPDGDGPLAARLDEYGPSPWAVALDAGDDAVDRLDDPATGTLLGREVAWVGPDGGHGGGRVAVPR